MLTIGYAGNLQDWDPRVNEKSGILRVLRDWTWSYQPRNIDASSRSGYYLFRGLQSFSSKYPSLVDSIQVKLWGGIRRLNREQVNEFELTELVEIGGYLDRLESYKKLLSCDVLFLPLESSRGDQRPLFIPGKLYEYLRTRKPVLALAEESDCVEILRESGLGIICSPFDSENIADTLAFLISKKDELPNLYAPNNEFIERFSFEKIVAEMANIFDDVLNSSE